MLKGLADQLKDKVTLAVKEQVSKHQNQHTSDDRPPRYERDEYDDGRGNHGRTERYEQQDGQGGYERHERQETHKTSTGGSGHTTHVTSYSSYSSSSHGGGNRNDDDGRGRKQQTQEQDHTLEHGHPEPHFNRPNRPPVSSDSDYPSSKYAQPDKLKHGSSTVHNIPGTDTQLHVSDCRGNKKALFIGINYTGMQAELKGCINDVRNIRQFVQKEYNFRSDHCVQLTDDQEEEKFRPTRANIIAAMKWLVKDAQPGDSLFLHYSGHGATVEDLDGDEVDGKDETIVPLDYETAGMLVDDEIHELLVNPLPKGCRLTAVFDCCHSGTVLDLPFTYKCDGEIELITESSHKEIALALLHAGLNFKRGDVGSTIEQLKEGFRLFTKPDTNAEAQKRTEKLRRSDADVIQFSGCRDDQTSADANIGNQPTGAMSYALIKVLRENNELNYTALLKKVRQELRGKYTQVPQMSTGRPMDMNTTFIM